MPRHSAIPARTLDDQSACNAIRHRTEIDALPVPKLCLLLSATLLLSPAPARAEWFGAVHFGVTQVVSGDLRLTEPGGTRLRFADPTWETHDFSDAIYWGLRAGRWFSGPGPRSGFGIALDLNHGKAYLKIDDVVRVTGSDAGAPVDERVPVGEYIAHLEMTHGRNFVTLNGLYRWVFDGSERAWLGRLRPYAGVGIGFSVPHVEASVDGVNTEHFQVGGPVFQLLVGLDVRVVGPFSLFAEYKGAGAVETVEIEGGGKFDLTSWSNQLDFGAGVQF